jgi:predicted kinase
MLILTCGLPGAGKSRAIDILSKHAKASWNIIRPSDWVPENLFMMSEEMQSAYNIECWSLALEKCKEAIEQLDHKKFIVLDGCNSKFNTVSFLIEEARSKLHKVALLFVQSDSKLCLARNAKLTEALLADYVERFKVSLPKYKKVCDLFLVARNCATLEQLETELHDAWTKLCQNT